MSEEISMVDYFKKFQEQMRSMSSNSNNSKQNISLNQPKQTTNNQIPLEEDYSGFSIGQGFDNQGKGLNNSVLKTPQNIPTINVTSTSKPSNQLELDNICPHCGTIHPILEPGQKCPIAQEKEQLKETRLSEEKVNKFVQDLKNIIITNLSKMKIESAEKVLQEITIEITKFLEKYYQSTT